MGILDGKIAIITGAGQGLGEGAAHAMTQEGACVALWGRTFEKVERVANDTIRPAAALWRSNAT